MNGFELLFTEKGRRKVASSFAGKIINDIKSKRNNMVVIKIEEKR